MAQINFSLHEEQAKIHNSEARFKVAAAGRQSGKTTVAVCEVVCAALANTSWGGFPLTTEHEVAYIYPTFEQGKKIVWPRLKAVIEPLGCQIYENTGLIVFPNGRRMRLLGADNPDSLRGFTWSFVVLDEYKDMSASVFEEVVRPALAVPRGGALFIGTPKGKNHFYDLYRRAQHDVTGEWAAFTFTSAANPYIEAREIKSMTADMSATLIAQEIEASFVAHGGTVFKPEDFDIDANEPQDGEWAIACDLAGFRKADARSKDYVKRDESAIAVVKVTTEGWWVKEIIHGQWDVQETALQILMAAKRCGCQRVGIEKGMSANAVYPYLTDLMRKYNRWLEVIPLSHGNQRKYDRIQWALQGRAEKGRIMLNPGPWNKKLVEQACDFPDPRSHDDLIDALSYVDQMAKTVYFDDFTGMNNEYEPEDSVLGY